MHPEGHRHVLGRLLLVVLVVTAVVPGAAAAQTEVGASVVVARGETVEEVTALAGTVLILGTVEGDVTALAGSVVVTGEVGGDVTAFGGTVEVSGDVGGEVTSFAVTLGIDGTVGGDVAAIGGVQRLGGHVRGSMDAIGVFVTVEDAGQLDGGLQTTAYQTAVNGSIAPASSAPPTGGTTSTGDSRNATVAGRAAEPNGAVGPSAVATLAAAQLGGADGPVPQLLPRLGRGGGFGLLDAYGFIVNLVLGMLLLGALPNFSTRVTAAVVATPVRSLAFGVATIVAVPVVLLVLALSLFGLPLALVGGLLYLALAWTGAAYGRVAVGGWLFAVAARVLGLLDVEVEPVQNRWANLLVGFLAVGLVLRIPYLGTLVDGVVVALGLGALASLAFDAYVRSERRPTTAPMQSPAERSGRDIDG